jgi:hypothetical protein
MTKKEGYSVEGLFGTVKHYDSKGHKIGESVPSVWGGYNNYDSGGHKIGETRPSFLGYNTYDNKGHKTGYTTEGFLGTNHYDAKGHRVGTTTPGFLGSNTYGSGSAGPDLVNRASAAAALQHDVAAHSIVSIAAQSKDLSATAGGHMLGKKAPPAPQVRQDIQPKAEIIRYVIVRLPGDSNSRYYRSCENVSVGDFIVVPDCYSPVQVLAAVMCETTAAPCSPESMPQVLRVKK